MNSNRDAQIKAFGRFLDVLDALRENCPWDKKQTNDSLRPNTIEEVYELCDALINDDTDNICKELGDVLLQVVMNAQIASEQGLFGFNDVVQVLCEKLIRRHPHVFGDVKKPTTPEESLAIWKSVKEIEKQRKNK